MDKVDFKIYAFVWGVGLLVLLLVIAGVNLKDVYVEKNKLIEQQERKIEALQEENSNLHDDVWNLNNQLMKGDE